MENKEYQLLSARHKELVLECDRLGEQIKNCKDPEAVKLLRADYRAYVHETNKIYEQMISASNECKS